MDEYVFDYLPPKNKAKKVNYASEHGFTLETLPPSFAVFNKMEHRYPLKYPNPEKDILSIIGIPTMEECRIFSQGGKPVFISDLAANHYGVSSMDELIGKPAMIFRRFKDASGNYEEPWRWHTYRITINSFRGLGRLDMAQATTVDDKGLEEEIIIPRICIDWDYKKLK